MNNTLLLIVYLFLWVILRNICVGVSKNMLKINVNSGPENAMIFFLF